MGRQGIYVSAPYTNSWLGRTEFSAEDIDIIQRTPIPG